ncbi:hypothetical protein AMK59_5713 [Oryctes borbonicus]|uniref:WAP domain-containing protein n=1 Tax=Oryctes borbonicus TaxID=1629725 RepID=A0A0T6AZZ9_9SCAR|nr:hypothetical protein AMK59_5713 [Oryctes borbonicus]
MAKVLIFISIALLVLLIETEAQTKGCPLASKITACSPKCKDDTECFGKKCCANICNTKSCVPDHLKNQGDDGYKKSGSSATGTYCGNVKCSAFEKCELDRNTKRQRCVRS